MRLSTRRAAAMTIICFRIYSRGRCAPRESTLWPASRIRRRYEAKRLSDESLTIHTIWWLYAYGHVTVIAFEHPFAPLAGLAAMVAFITVTRTGFGRTPTGDARSCCCCDRSRLDLAVSACSTPWKSTGGELEAFR